MLLVVCAVLLYALISLYTGWRMVWFIFEETIYSPYPDGEDLALSMLAGLLWPLVALGAVMYKLGKLAVAHPPRVIREKRAQEKATEEEREAQAAARRYDLPYPKVDDNR